MRTKLRIAGWKATADAPNDAFKLCRYGTFLSGTFAGLAEGDDVRTPDGYGFTLHYAGGLDEDEVRLTLHTIPEPGTRALLLGASALLSVRRRLRIDGRERDASVR